MSARRTASMALVLFSAMGLAATAAPEDRTSRLSLLPDTAPSSDGATGQGWRAAVAAHRPLAAAGLGLVGDASPGHASPGHASPGHAAPLVLARAASSTPRGPAAIQLDGGQAAPADFDLPAPPSPSVLDPAQPVNGEVALVADEQPLAYLGNDGERIDAPRLRVWLEGRGSPMADYAEELVAAGVANDVDPRLVVAIATKESSAGLRLPPGSHNAWGWGGSGAYGLAAWPSWPAAIEEYTERLGALYDTDNVDEHMAQVYCPPNWRDWLSTVRWVIADI